MTDKRFISLVTADETLIARHKERLSREFDLNVFRDAGECRAALNVHRPDILIIDTGLPNDAGFNLHRELRDDFDLSDLYQLLLCDEADIAREGFDADDELLKPFGDIVFMRKLTQLGKTLAAKDSAREQMAYAQNVAFTSMSAMGELGVVMQFLSKSFSCANIQAVGSLAIEALRQYDLQGAVYLIWEGDGLALTTEGDALAPATRQLIEQRRTLGRILEIDQSLVVNYDHATILISNLPEDSQRLGRIRDNIATLTEGIESRIQGLLIEHDNLLKQQGIRYASWEIRDSVKNLDARQTADLVQTRTLTSQVIDEYENAFLHMGIQPEIENQLIGELVELRRKISDIIGRPSEVSEKLQIVIASLDTMAGQFSTSD